MKFFIFLLIFILSSDLIAQVNVKIGKEIATIYPFSMNEIDLQNQLLPLKGLFCSKSIIGMGEATHGTREFFVIKTHVFQWLVKECNYRIFGIEASYSGCCYINDFVLSNEGNIDSVMYYLDFWTWQTEEVRDLILWIKDYNAKHSEKLTFCGFDMQNFYSPIQYFNEFTKKYFKSEYDIVNTISFPILSKTELKIYQLLQNKKSKFEDTLKQTHKKLTEWLVFNKNKIETTQSIKHYQTLLLNIENLGQAIQSFTIDNISKFRDSCMADNVLKIQNMENKKMFIWAHNGHINLAYPEEKYSLMGLQLGGQLRKNIGEAYYSIGFVFNQGSFQSIQGPKSLGSAIFKFIFAKKKMYQGLKECNLPIHKKNTFTNLLSETSFPVYFLDVSKSENPIFSTVLKTYDTGSIFMNYNRCSANINAKKLFDGLIYVDKTTRARPVLIKK